MFVVKVIIDVFITPGSGQTTVVMPTMAPLSEGIEVVRQAARMMGAVWRRLYQSVYAHECKPNVLPGGGKSEPEAVV